MEGRRGREIEGYIGDGEKEWREGGWHGSWRDQGELEGFRVSLGIDGYSDSLWLCLFADLMVWGNY